MNWDTFYIIYIYIYWVQNSVFADRCVPEKLLRCGGGKELKNELWNEREYIIQSTARKRLKRNKESKDPKLISVLLIRPIQLP
jgi:CRISPR/Cas system-associated endoribonuclease Cas2